MPNWDFYNSLANVSAFSVLVPMLFFYAERKRSLVHKLLFVYLLLSLFTEIILMVISTFGRSNLYVVEIFKIVELFLLVGIFISSGLFTVRQVKYIRLIPLSGCGFVVGGYLIHWTGLFDGFAHACIILLSLTAFYRIFLVSDQVSLNSHSFFWFNFAFFLYFSASFFLFLFGNLIRTFEEIAKLLWTFHLFANILFYYILSVGAWKQKTI